jgi:two-component system OmpR family response regulator
MLSAMGTPSDRVEGLEVGANDYLPKPFLCRELLLRLQHLMSRSKPELQRHHAQPQLRTGHTYLIGDLIFDPGAGSLRVGGEDHGLTPGEVSLLLIFCEAPSLCHSRNDLLRLSGSFVTESTSRTIDVRVSRLRRKLKELNYGVDLIETVRGQGYRLAAVPLSEA